jgi:molybdate transport system substrate-binding protein
MRWLALLLLALCAAPEVLAVAGSRAANPPLVLAAASLQEAMTAAADRWAAAGHPRPVVSFAASSVLARQIAAGAPADLFVSADEPWMDDLAKRGLIVPATRTPFLRNTLVLVAPAASRTRINIGNRRVLAASLAAGPLAMADPDTVPAGKYGRAALTKLGVWDAVATRVVRADNVRAALLLVERGAAPYGIVYATDARASAAVRIVATFPASSHPPIVYPLARLTASRNPEAEGFRRFLLSDAGRAIFARFGFGTR